MDEHALREMITDVKAGRMTRRSFVRTMVGLGLTASMAGQMLAAGGVAAQPKTPAFAPTRRGGGGPLKTLWWQAPTLLNPHFATGTKDQDGSRIFYEPLAAYDPDGNLSPVLAADIPSVENGGLGRDGKWVVWNLKKGVTWHDGKPFTADDVVFNWEYAADPATAAVTIGAYREIERVERLNDHAVKVVFKQPTPFWFEAFCGQNRALIPKHLFAAYKGDKSREAPTNLKPVGTGPYRFVDFKPGDIVRGDINPTYHVANRPFFDSFEMKGGGDAPSAARAVLQTGEYDFAWNIQVEDDILRRLEQGGKGRAEIYPTGNIEHIQRNTTDPWREVDGERSSVKTTHPTLSDPAVRQALSLLVDRASVHEQIYGRQGQATANYLNAPPRFYSPQHPLGVQRGQGQPDPGRGGLEARGRRGARQGRQAAQVRLPDLHQRPPPEDPGHRQAGGRQGRHRDRDQVGGGLRLLRVGRGQPGHLPPLLLGPADVHDHDRRRSSLGDARVHQPGGREQGQQVAGAKHHPVAQRGVRPPVEGRRDRDGSGQAGRPSSSG